MMYEIRTKWSNMVVYRTTERSNALYWMEENNQEGVFKLVRIKWYTVFYVLYFYFWFGV